VKKRLLGFIKNHHPVQILIAVFTVGLVFWIVFLNRDDLVRLFHFQLWNIIAIIFVYILQFVTSAMALWFIISRLSSRSVPIINWIKIMFVSRMANNMVPRSGGVYKALVLKNDYEMSYTKFVHIYAFFSWLIILLNLGLVALLIFLFMPTLEMGNYPALLIITGAFFATLSGPLVVKRILDLFNPKDNFISGISEKIHGIFITILRHCRDINFMSKLVGALLVKFGLNVLLFKLIFTGMNIEIGYAQMALFIAVQQVSALTFITPGNIGIRELLYGVLGGTIGIGLTEGVIASAVLRAVDYLVTFPLGIAFGGSKFFGSLISRSRSEEGR